MFCTSLRLTLLRSSLSPPSACPFGHCCQPASSTACAPVPIRVLNLRKMSVSSELSPIEKAKRTAAFACGDAFIKSNQKIGVGSGSTVKYLVEYLGNGVKSGKLENIVCVPTSYMTRRWLLDAGLNVSSVEETYDLDICIDGADEVDKNLNLIKGGGGCLTQEKIVQTCAKKFVVIADSNKKSVLLGDKYPVLPVEVVQTAYVPVQQWIKQAHGGEVNLRISATKCFPLITDNNNYILEWNFPKGQDRDWKQIHQSIVNLPGVVETGLFLDVAEQVYLATPEGTVEILRK